MTEASPRARFEIVDVSLGENTLGDAIVGKGLIDTEDPQKPRPAPITVDFLSPKLKHRIKNGADSEAIVKALGVKRSERRGKLVYDFTAGLGTEAFLLAQAGYSVVAFERDERVFKLLEDGLHRWRAHEDELEIATEDRLQLEFRLGDAAQIFAKENAAFPRAYVVTLDPMFEDEATEGKSLPKKEMATLRRMLSPSSEADLRALFDAAFVAAESRVVVKRPHGAPDLVSANPARANLKPVRRLEGKTARFDIYASR